MRRPFFLVVLAIVLCGAAAGAQVLEHRAWQLQSREWDVIKNEIPMAAEMGMNRIQLSHAIIMDAEELWDDFMSSWRLNFVRDLIKLSHDNDLKVDIWVHEFSGVPKKFVEDGRLVIQPDLWKWLRAKYKKVFKLIPEVDGLVLTFAETEYELYNSETVDAGGDVLDSFLKTVDVIAGVCEENGKTLIVRTFIHRPEELEILQRAVHRIAVELKHRKNIIIMSKAVPHDWIPYYPYSTALGNTEGLPQIVELDQGEEYTAMNWVLHAEVEYIKNAMDYAREKGVIGAVSRIERYNNYAIGCPNEVNVYAFSRLLHDPSLTTGQIWNEWAVKRYGEKAAPYVISAMRRTFDITNIIIYPIGQWINNHSSMSNWGYAYSHLMDYGGTTVARWIPGPYHMKNYHEAIRPDRDIFIKVSHEKDLARKLLAESVRDLESAKPFLSGDDYGEFDYYFTLTAEALDIHEEHALAFFKTLRVVNLRGEGGSSAEIGSLKSEIAVHLETLREQGAKFGAKYPDKVFGGLPALITLFCDSIEEELAK